MDDTGAVSPDDVRSYCAAKPGAWEDRPWEDDVVFKVGPAERGKIFVFYGDGTSIGVKAAATRDEADDWLARYPDDARVSRYIGRSGWNVLSAAGGIPDDELREAIDTSYELVVSGLPKKYRPGVSS